MMPELTSKEWVRSLMDESPNVIFGEPTFQIWLKNTSTGECRVEKINEDSWRDGVCSSGLERIWAEEGFALAEDPLQPSQAPGFSSMGLWIDDISGQIMDLELQR